MSTFSLNIETDNAAFEGDPRDELRRLLQILDQQLDAGQDRGRMIDVNGNTVGSWAFKGDGQPVHMHSDGPCVVVTGSPADGLQFIGPFQAHWEAEKFCEQNRFDESWWIAPLAQGV